MPASPPDLIRRQVANDFAALGECITEVRGFLCAWQLASDDIADVLVVVDELASNVIRHAWPEGGAHNFVLEVAVKRTDGIAELSITLADNGLAFDPTVAAPPDPAPLSVDYAVGGFGLGLVTAISNDIAYHRSDGRNHLTIRMLAGRRKDPRNATQLLD